MTEWTRALRDGFCRGCGKPLVAGEPIRLTSIVGVTRKFVRCQECVGAAPADLPAVTPPKHGNVVQPMNPIVPRERRRQPNEWMPYRDGE